MGVKSYVAGMRADSINTGINMVSNLYGLIANDVDNDEQINRAKDETDFNREVIGIGNSLDEFVGGLKYDRDYQNYGNKVKEQFDSLQMGINENTNISQRVKNKIIQEQFPLLREKANGIVKTLTTNAQMTEIQVEIESYGNVISSNQNLSLDQTTRGYRDHIESLNLFNPATVNKMVKEYTYAVAPVKVLQELQGQYKENYADDSFNYDKTLNSLVTKYGLDAAQTKSLIEKASAEKKKFDTQVDDQFKETKNSIEVQVAETFDNGQLFEASSLDSLIETVPTRHKLELYASKNKIYANNDELLVGNLESEIEKGTFFTDSGWDTIDMIHDPKKRSATKVKAMQANINNTLSGLPYQGKIEAVYNTELPLTDNEKIQVTAELTKAELINVSPQSVAKSLLELTKSKENPKSVDKSSQSVANNTTDSEQGVDDLSVDSSQNVNTNTTEREFDVTKREETTQDVNIDSNKIEPTPVQQESWEARTKAGTAYLKELERQSSAVNVLDNLGEDIPEFTPITADMPQENIVSNLLLRVEAGYGSKITQEELSFISNKDTRDVVSSMAGDMDTLIIDDPSTVNMVKHWRIDPTITQETLTKLVRDLQQNKLLKVETAEKLIRKSVLGENENGSRIKDVVKSIVNNVYDTGDINRTVLEGQILDSIELAIKNNPKLITDDYEKLVVQVTNYALSSLASTHLNRMVSLSKLVTKQDLEGDIKALESKDLNTFMYKVNQGDYDTLINYARIQTPEMQMIRNMPRDQILDRVSKEFSGYDSYKDLETNGTDFERMEVLVNSNFLAASGLYEQALYGSFGIVPKRMKVSGRNWVFEDPANPNVYFAPAYSDSFTKNGLSWGMFTEQDGLITKKILFKDYVDPSLTYDYEELGKEITDPLFKKNHDAFLNPSPSRTSMTANVPEQTSWSKYYGPKSTQDDNQEQVTRSSRGVDPYQKKIDKYASLEEEIKILVNDITQYRANLLGVQATGLRARL